MVRRVVTCRCSARRTLRHRAGDEEAIQSRVQAGVEHSSDVAIGRDLGHKVAALAIARGKARRIRCQVDRQRSGRRTVAGYEPGRIHGPHVEALRARAR